jgi:hypothetical protein
VARVDRSARSHRLRTDSANSKVGALSDFIIEGCSFMKLHARTQTPKIALVAINGDPIVVGNGRKMLLSRFREATCPSCDFRVFELTAPAAHA